MFPIATPILSVKAEKIDTERAGNDVQKATRINPVVVFPEPVTSATLTALSIVESLALSKTTSATTRINMLMSSPSNKATVHLLINCLIKLFKVV
jgi:hypothetical protein